MTKLLNHKQVKPLLSDKHFSADGTLAETCASHKIFKPKDGSGGGDGANWNKQKRSNETHASTTDPQSRLSGRRQRATRSSASWVISPWRTGTALGGMVTSADGAAECDAAQAMLRAKRKEGGPPITAGADKAYDAKDHVMSLRAFDVTPHVGQNMSLTKTG